MTTAVAPLNELLKRRVQSRIDGNQSILATFKAKLDSDPTYAFEWADDAMKAAAALGVWRSVLEALEAGAAPEDLVRSLNARALHHARYPRHSTSPSANAMYANEASVFAEAAEFIEFSA